MPVPGAAQGYADFPVLSILVECLPSHQAGCHPAARIPALVLLQKRTFHLPDLCLGGKGAHASRYPLPGPQATHFKTIRTAGIDRRGGVAAWHPGDGLGDPGESQPGRRPARQDCHIHSFGNEGNFADQDTSFYGHTGYPKLDD